MTSREDMYLKRLNMQRLFSEKNFAKYIIPTIIPLFENSPESEKEMLAQRIIEIVEPCKTEQGAVQRIMEAFPELAQ